MQRDTRREKMEEKRRWKCVKCCVGQADEMGKLMKNTGMMREEAMEHSEREGGKDKRAIIHRDRSHF